MKTAKEYVESLKKLDLKVYLLGEQVKEPTEHPMIKPSLNSVTMTYALAQQEEYADIMTTVSNLTGEKINRFTHLHQSTEDLVKKVKMCRLLGQKTSACFQRCVGMDAGNAVYTSTKEIDDAKGTNYHERFIEYWKYIQKNDLVVDGAMTDPKGNRGFHLLDKLIPTCI